MYFYSEMAWMWCVAGQWTTGHCVPPLAPDCGDIDVKIKEKEQGTDGCSRTRTRQQLGAYTAGER